MSEKQPVTPPAGFDWQGHRGCRGILPENSIPAFIKALEFAEVTTLELDLAVSKDNQLIVSHEPWFNPAICRLPNGDTIPEKDAERYRLYAYTAEEIRAFDCGSRGNPRFPEQQKMAVYKPTLRETVREVLAHYPIRENTLRWNIEIKSQPDWDNKFTPPVEQFAQLVVRELDDLGIKNQATVQSFDVRALQAVRRIDPSIQLALLVENDKGVDDNLQALGFTPLIYSPYHELLSRKVVKYCHKKGMKVIPWTVNEPEPMRKLIRMGVDGIITDYPNRISAAVGL